jgi:hypothetical protein
MATCPTSPFPQKKVWLKKKEEGDLFVTFAESFTQV